MQVLAFYPVAFGEQTQVISHLDGSFYLSVLKGIKYFAKMREQVLSGNFLPHVKNYLVLNIGPSKEGNSKAYCHVPHKLLELSLKGFPLT